MSVRVFPLPAPAMTRSGPYVKFTASNWDEFNAFLNIIWKFFHFFLKLSQK